MPVRCLSGVRLPDDGFDVSELLTEIYRAEQDQEWDRKVGVYHPSGIKGCKRALYYDITEEPPRRTARPSALALFDLGHAIHDKLQSRYSGDPDFTDEANADFKPLKLYGHTDGVFKAKDWLLEIKSIADASFRTLVKPKIEAVWQIHCYMFAFDIPRAQILYVNRNNGLRRNFKVYFTYDIWQEILDVINHTDECVEAGTIPPRESNQYICRTCKFKHVCRP